MKVVQGEAELFEVVGTLDTGGGLADLLDGGKEKSDQSGDDGNDNKKFNEGEADPLFVSELGFSGKGTLSGAWSAHRRGNAHHLLRESHYWVLEKNGGACRSGPWYRDDL
jgi:hypothetical protein